MPPGKTRGRTPIRIFLIGVVTALLPSCSVAVESPPETKENVHGEPAETPAPPLVTPCLTENSAAIEELVLGQSEALADRDFELAYGFASPDFRSSVSVELFERVITRQYDMLLYFDSATFGPCDSVSDSRAIMNVLVTSKFHQPVVMIYDVVFIDGKWWVSAVENPANATPNA